MPLNTNGRKIKAAMVKEYGQKKGESVFYASENAGKISNVTKSSPRLRAAAVKHYEKKYSNKRV